MPGIQNVASAFCEFMQSWEEDRKYLPSSISALANGFEGWLKFEFYFWLIQARGLRGRDRELADVGVEYKVALDQRWSLMDIAAKQCDLWIRDQDEKRFHFIELKAPFANANQGKMFESAAKDYWYMTRLKAQAEKVATGSVIIFGVNFEEARWKKHLQYVEDYAGYIDHTSKASGTVPGVAGLRWAVLTMHYPSSGEMPLPEVEMQER
ncbi:hypothetical protein SAMN03159382_02835 [Pseudomonas sp. NFACC23-1]|uniref:hypothetical protein n=1 Tax=unclassified Pseudomonas TaxID=196821 RepID=UPI00088C17C4|nr:MULTISPECIES: hypothetical protein [unclassified Pseudomonas]SDB33646.1 hypothetical protein SAMN03159386_02427 [Pseudomonas sp. NFACC17-2]SEJ49716.1 hypothetical protein SAMN03159382_02835 [Pseudomonas sp. NFACC23-1]SFW70290.1 hypothetical protein SAMN05660640_02833 [Pseudomonas sp. NFACC16-2]